MSKEQFLDFLSRMATMKEIIKLNNPEKYEELIKKEMYWTPETRPSKYSDWVMQNYEFNPDDPLSICIYSLLMNVPMSQVKEKMNEDSYESKIKKR